MPSQNPWPRRGQPIPAHAATSSPLRYSRGYLPHVKTLQSIQMVTYRLADSLPAHVVQRLLASKEADESGSEARKKIETFLDAGHGNCWLARPPVAEIVRDSWKHFDGERYRLHAWVIMPNHVHVLVEEFPGYPLRQVVKTRKSFSERAANECLQGRGTFWQREYWDRFIRNERHYAAALSYIVENPVKAGLVQAVEDWPWCSWNDGRERKPEE